MLEDIAWLVLSCRGCLGPLAGAACKRCMVLHVLELCCQGEELLEEVSRLCGIREGMKETNWIISETLQEPRPSTMVAEHAAARFESGNALDGEGCPDDFWQQKDGSCSTQKLAVMA